VVTVRRRQPPGGAPVDPAAAASRLHPMLRRALPLSLPSRHSQQQLRQQLCRVLSSLSLSSQRPCRPTISRLRWPTAPPRPSLPRAPASVVVFAKVKPNRAFPLRRDAMTAELGSPWPELFRYCSPSIFLSTVSASLL
jgi:hypothetical protein